MITHIFYGYVFDEQAGTVDYKVWLKPTDDTARPRRRQIVRLDDGTTIQMTKVARVDGQYAEGPHTLLLAAAAFAELYPEEVDGYRAEGWTEKGIDCWFSTDGAVEDAWARWMFDSSLDDDQVAAAWQACLETMDPEARAWFEARFPSDAENRPSEASEAVVAVQAQDEPASLSGATGGLSGEQLATSGVKRGRARQGRG